MACRHGPACLLHRQTAELRGLADGGWEQIRRLGQIPQGVGGTVIEMRARVDVAVVALRSIPHTPGTSRPSAECRAHLAMCRRALAGRMTPAKWAQLRPHAEGAWRAAYSATLAVYQGR